jgi:hypothetical protein
MGEHMFRGRYDFVDGYGAGRRGPGTHPYSYDPFYLWGGEKEAKAKGVSAAYSDRISTWYDNFDARFKKHVGKRWSQASPEELSALMSDCMEKRVEVVALAEGANQATGYPYWIVWMKIHEPQSVPAPLTSGQSNGDPQ